MPKIPFTKMHGCGNDYIYVNAIDHPIADPARAAVAWSDRHKGIGSDGLVLIDRSPVPEADFSMRIFNADGSEAMMCGNASRCIGKYLYERGLTTQTHIRLLTLSGVKMLELHVAPAAAAVPAGVAAAATVPGGFAAGASAVPAAVPAASPAGSSPAAGASAQSLPSLQGNCEEGAIGERSDGGAKPGPGVGSVTSVTVDMGEPVLEDENLFNPQIAKSLSTPLAPWRGDGGEAGIFVSMGNPHYVIFTDNIDQVADTGRALEHHPAFPQRCNIEFAKITDPTPGPSPTREGSGCATVPAASPAGLAPAIRTRVWERGSGITQACGTGACATAVAACITGRAGRRSRIVMDGGSLDIEWRETDNHVYMTGPAAFVFDGEVEIP